MISSIQLICSGIGLPARSRFGKDIQALITYLSVYQSLPSNRIKSYLKDVMGVIMDIPVILCQFVEIVK